MKHSRAKNLKFVGVPLSIQRSTRIAMPEGREQHISPDCIPGSRSWQGSSQWPCRYELTDIDTKWLRNWRAAPVAQDHSRTEIQHPLLPTTFQGQYMPSKSRVLVQGFEKVYAEHPQQPEILYSAYYSWCRNNTNQQNFSIDYGPRPLRLIANSWSNSGLLDSISLWSDNWPTTKLQRRWPSTAL